MTNCTKLVPEPAERLKMEKPLVLIVFGAVMALICHGAPTSSVENEITTSGRDECIRQVAHYLSQIEIDKLVSQHVRTVRYEYVTDLYGSRFSFDYYPDGCKRLHKQIRALKCSVPCYYDQTVMGVDELQNVKDVLMQNDESKFVVESDYACFHHYGSGTRMREDGLFELITGTQYRRERDPNREEVEKRLRAGGGGAPSTPVGEQISTSEQSVRTKSILFNYDAKPEDPSKLDEWERRRQLVQGHASPRELLLTLLDSSSSTNFEPNFECPICGDELSSEPRVAKLTNCGHVFHEQCLMSWSKTKEKETLESLCPVCRESFQKWD
uniref:RING-type domain-containing protein n=1 Tax=Aceria tosichella TaxID=561515 RepID=A0A6G1SQI3_9ACAR